MLWVLALILFILWILGFAVFHVAGHRFTCCW